MKGLLISSGSLSNYEQLKEYSKEADYILCADGGIKHAIKSQILPNAIIGDLDSIGDEEMKFIHDNNVPIIKYPVEKDETDTELGINYLSELGIKDISLFGATGTRIDHTLGNVFLLRKLLKNKINGRVVDDNNIIYLIDEFLKLPKRNNYYVSIIPISEKGIVVTLKGFYYPLINAKINFGSTLGISNKIIDAFGEVNILHGEALIIESRD